MNSKRTSPEVVKILLAAIAMLLAACGGAPKTFSEAWQACDLAKGEPTGNKFSGKVVAIEHDAGDEMDNNISVSPDMSYHGLHLREMNPGAFVLSSDILADDPGSTTYGNPNVGAILCINASYFTIQECQYYGGLSIEDKGLKADILLVRWPLQEIIARAHAESAPYASFSCPAETSVSEALVESFEVNGLTFEQWIKQYLK